VRHNDGQGRFNHEIARTALDKNNGVTLAAQYLSLYRQLAQPRNEALHTVQEKPVCPIL
jgi:hypothetical protein